ncbi:hypothetical protein A6P39_000305 [Streptomyces sp. FXJ1.172]|nr:hypothetical protein [Streptomyces sp. FXJ1.172]WEO92697.1 hypothetical protein A6P39_000305 [Streptomyces sp. FXJ1.172]
MVAPILPYLSPERLEYLQQLADASRGFVYPKGQRFSTSFDGSC